jgi:hypothetical protein
VRRRAGRSAGPVAIDQLACRLLRLRTPESPRSAAGLHQPIILNRAEHMSGSAGRSIPVLLVSSQSSRRRKTVSTQARLGRDRLSRVTAGPTAGPNPHGAAAAAASRAPLAGGLLQSLSPAPGHHRSRPQPKHLEEVTTERRPRGATRADQGLPQGGGTGRAGQGRTAGVVAAGAVAAGTMARTWAKETSSWRAEWAAGWAAGTRMATERIGTRRFRRGGLPLQVSRLPGAPSFSLAEPYPAVVARSTRTSRERCRRARRWATRTNLALGRGRWGGVPASADRLHSIRSHQAHRAGHSLALTEH